MINCQEYTMGNFKQTLINTWKSRTCAQLKKSKILWEKSCKAVGASLSTKSFSTL